MNHTPGVFLRSTSYDEGGEKPHDRVSITLVGQLSLDVTMYILCK